MNTTPVTYTVGLRDTIAIEAMREYLRQKLGGGADADATHYNDIARWSYLLADSMMNAREGRVQEEHY